MGCGNSLTCNAPDFGFSDRKTFKQGGFYHDISPTGFTSVIRSFALAKSTRVQKINHVLFIIHICNVTSNALHKLHEFAPSWNWILTSSYLVHRWIRIQNFDCKIKVWNLNTKSQLCSRLFSSSRINDRNIFMLKTVFHKTLLENPKNIVVRYNSHFQCKFELELGV